MVPCALGICACAVASLAHTQETLGPNTNIADLTSPLFLQQQLFVTSDGIDRLLGLLLLFDAEELSKSEDVSGKRKAMLRAVARPKKIAVDSGKLTPCGAHNINTVL